MDKEKEIEKDTTVLRSINYYASEIFVVTSRHQQFLK